MRPGIAQPGMGNRAGTTGRGSIVQPDAAATPDGRNNAGRQFGNQFGSRSGIAGQNNQSTQSLGGNTVKVGQTTINIASQSYQPSYTRYLWYNGYWGGNYGWGGSYGPGFGWGYGPGFGLGYGGLYAGYGFRPLGWGWGGWGLGALLYNSGYLGYSNPYYSGGGVYGNYNYSQPIPVAYDNSMTTAASSCKEKLDSAIQSFRQNDFDAALDMANQGVSQCPNDSVIHEFRALVLFAKGDYQQAAATIHSVLAVGPGWDWTTMSRLYATVGNYTNQLRTLENFTKENPDDAASRFLLAYHYMTTGHPDAAARHLKQVVKLMPNDRVAADVLKMITAPSQAGEPGQAADQRPTPQPPTEPQPAARSIDPAMLVGSWSAARDDGSKFELTLTKEGTFTWRFSQKETVQEFGGKYKLEGNVLALERKEGGSLIATVKPDGDERFNFRMLGAPSEDTGLDFHR